MFGKKFLTGSAKKHNKPKTSVSLSPAEVAVLKKLQAAVDHQEKALAELRGALAALVVERYGVDLTEDTWTLDLDQGTLVKET